MTSKAWIKYANININAPISTYTPVKSLSYIAFNAPISTYPPVKPSSYIAFNAPISTYPPVKSSSYIAFNAPISTYPPVKSSSYIAFNAPISTYPPVKSSSYIAFNAPISTYPPVKSSSYTAFNASISTYPPVKSSSYTAFNASISTYPPVKSSSYTAFYASIFNNLPQKILIIYSFQERSQRLYHVEAHKIFWELRDIWPCYFTFQIANDKGTDLTARMRRLLCAFVVCNQEKSGFLVSMPIWYWSPGFLASAWLRLAFDASISTLRLQSLPTYSKNPHHIIAFDASISIYPSKNSLHI